MSPLANPHHRWTHRCRYQYQLWSRICPKNDHMFAAKPELPRSTLTPTPAQSIDAPRLALTWIATVEAARLRVRLNRKRARHFQITYCQR